MKHKVFHIKMGKVQTLTFYANNSIISALNVLFTGVTRLPSIGVDFNAEHAKNAENSLISLRSLRSAMRKASTA